MLRKILAVMMVLAASLAGTVPVFAQGNPSGSSNGAVYLMSNSASGNQVLAYSRAADGSLDYTGTYATGGLGSGVGATVPPDPLGSQNSIIISPDGSMVFAVNAGSNEISSFQVTVDGLRLADRASSAGTYPVSLTYSDGLLYALNAGGDGNITGFKVDGKAHLHSIQNSTRSLHAATPDIGSQPNILEAPAQVGFSPNGNFLIVTDKGAVSGVGKIDVFRVDDGKPSAAPAITQTAGPVPFAFSFDRSGNLVVVDAAAGSVTSYAIAKNGNLSVLDTAFTGQAATCWIGTAGRYIFTDNTGSGSISGFSAAPSGKLTPVTASSIVVTTGAGSLPLDMGVSRDGRYIYSLETGLGAVGIYHVQPDGSVTALGTAAPFPAIGGFQGIAVR